jgi:hypothetical protein
MPVVNAARLSRPLEGRALILRDSVSHGHGMRCEMTRIQGRLPAGAWRPLPRAVTELLPIRPPGLRPPGRGRGGRGGGSLLNFKLNARAATVTDTVTVTVAVTRTTADSDSRLVELPAD